MRAFIILIATLFLAIAANAHAQGISQLQQFTSTTSPAAAITQTVFGKAFRLTGQSSGCAQFSANGTLTSSGTSCGSTFSYPFPSNATTTQITFSSGIVANVTGNSSTATALAANGANCSAGHYPLGVDASGAVETCTADTNTTYTAGDALTLTGTDFDFDGGATPSGDLGGTWASPSVTDDSHNHTGSTLSGIDISSDTNLAATYPVLLTGDTLSLAFGTTTSNTWAGTQTFTNLITGSVSGNAGTATALAANGANCSVGNYPLGVDASGAVESCTALAAGTSPFEIATTSNIAIPEVAYFTQTSGRTTLGSVATGTVSSGAGISVTAGRAVLGGSLAITNTGVTSITGTANQITASAATGAVTLSFPSLLNITSASTTNLTCATFCQMANGSSITPLLAGVFGWDTTSGQFKVGNGTATKVIGNGSFYPSFRYATTTTWTGTTTIALGPAYVAETWNGWQCFTDAGFLAVVFHDGTNNMNYAVASATVGTVTLASNNTYTAAEKRYVSIGTTTTSVAKEVACTVNKSLTAD